MIRRKIFVVLAVLFTAVTLVACATTENYEAGLNYWIGRSDKELLMAWGVPDKQYQMDTNTKMISYVKRDTEVYPSSVSTCVGAFGQPLGFGGCSGLPPAVSTYRCETTFIITHGRVTRWGHEGNDCRA